MAEQNLFTGLVNQEADFRARASEETRSFGASNLRHRRVLRWPAFLLRWFGFAQ